MAVLPPILVILGPTASGKSALADELARQCGAEILSVDSMQVYRGMDIGTAKPTAAERERVPHHLIDVADPNELFTVARFVELADGVIADAAGRRAVPTPQIGRGHTPSPGTPGEGGGEGDFERQGASATRNHPHPNPLPEYRERGPEIGLAKVTKPGVPLIATGGTPLYYKALFEGLFDGPRADETLRASLAQIPNEQLHERLNKIDPQAAARIHPNDSRRMIRALEVFVLTGQPISSFQTDWNSPTPRHPATFIGLHWEKEALNRRINARVKAMIAAGWVEETRALLDRYGQLSQTAVEATGYREIIDHIQGKLRLDDAIEQIKIATRQLARKQMKWFRRFANVKWLAGEVPTTENAELILRNLPPQA